MPQFLTTALLKVAGGALTAAQAGAVVNIGLSAALNAATAALQRSGSSREEADAGNAPSSRPPYRHLYGRSREQGVYAPGWSPFYDKTNGILYACILLNSRESAGGVVRLFADERGIGLTGDPYDFGSVASGTATVLEGNTSVTITHGMASTPDSGRCWTADGVFGTVSAITATEMTLTIGGAAPAGGTPVNWSALVETDGATATNGVFEDHLSAWIGLGDQTHPPARILAEWGDPSTLNKARFWPSDKWSGCTVLWLRLERGLESELPSRWPSWPTPAFKVEMNWSKVWNPRDETQDAADPSTWEYSDNQALCLLDALMQNPVERYPLTGLRIGDFEDAADVADQDFALKSGATQRRFRVAGHIVYAQGIELFQQLQPLQLAGAGELLRIGGRVGYRPGVAQSSAMTITQAMRGSMQFTRTGNGRGLPGALRVSFPDRFANWEMSPLAPYQVDPAWDGGESRITGVDLHMVPFPVQAMLVQKVMAETAKQEKKLSFTAPPGVIEVVAGAQVTVDFPRAGDARNGDYRVVSTAPAQWMQDDAGAMTFAMPITLEGTSAAVYAWNPATDEQDFYRADEVLPDPTMPDPLDLDSTVSGTAITVSIWPPGTLVTDPNVAWIPDADAPELEWEFRRNDESFWQGGGVVSNNSQTVADTLSPVATGESYDLRVRCVGDDRVSDWLYHYAVQVGFALAAPGSVTATGESGNIALSATAPVDADFDAIQFWASEIDDFEASVLVSEQSGSGGDTLTHDHTVATGQTRFYFVRCLTANRAVSAYATASATAT